MNHETVFELDYSTWTHADRVLQSIRPEVGDISDDRSRTTVDRDGETLVVTIEAADLVALRAAVNTWLSLVAVAEDTGGICESKSR